MHRIAVNSFCFYLHGAVISILNPKLTCVYNSSTKSSPPETTSGPTATATSNGPPTTTSSTNPSRTYSRATTQARRRTCCTCRTHPTAGAPSPVSKCATAPRRGRSTSTGSRSCRTPLISNRPSRSRFAGTRRMEAIRSSDGTGGPWTRSSSTRGMHTSRASTM